MQAIFKIPQDTLRALIVWALGGEPVLKQPEPAYDPAALDAVVAEIKNP
jgi:hypothetical protein